MASEKRYDIFISYRREGGQTTARILRDSLTERGYDVFFDVESLRSGAFNTKLYSVIEECKDFVLILSPNALDRCKDPEDWVRREIEHAIKTEKNIIPILLRDFTFPDTLPESMQDLPYQNGLAANLEYYDAFVDKLESFLVTKKTVRARIGEAFRRVKRLPLILAACVLCAAIVAAVCFLRYPRTTEQISLTNHVTDTVATYLIDLDLMADAQHDMLEAAEEYLATGDTEVQQTSFAACYQTLTQIQFPEKGPTENLLDWMLDSPFNGGDMRAMYEYLPSFREDSLSNLAFVEFILGEESMLDVSEKQAYVSLYKDWLKQEKKLLAIETNLLLLPITRSEYLETFWTNTLPYLEEVPLNGRNWSRSKKALLRAEAEGLDELEAILVRMQEIVAAEKTEQDEDLEAIRQQLVEAGYTQARADLIVSYMGRDWVSELTGKYLRQGSTAEEAAAKAEQEAQRKEQELEWLLHYELDLTAEPQTVWDDMIRLMGLGLYEEAERCIALYQTLMPNSDRYGTGLIVYLELLKAGELDYGIMVMDYKEDEGINDQLMIGDIIYQVNGEPCRTTADYISMKEAVTADSYTVKLCRWDKELGLQVLEQTISMDAPRVYLNDLSLVDDAQ